MTDRVRRPAATSARKIIGCNVAAIRAHHDLLNKGDAATARVASKKNKVLRYSGISLAARD